MVPQDTEHISFVGLPPELHHLTHEVPDGDRVVVSEPEGPGGCLRVRQIEAEHAEENERLWRLQLRRQVGGTDDTLLLLVGEAEELYQRLGHVLVMLHLLL